MEKISATAEPIAPVCVDEATWTRRREPPVMWPRRMKIGPEEPRGKVRARLWGDTDLRDSW